MSICTSCKFQGEIPHSLRHCGGRQYLPTHFLLPAMLLMPILPYCIIIVGGRQYPPTHFLLPAMLLMSILPYYIIIVRGRQYPPTHSLLPAILLMSILPYCTTLWEGGPVQVSFIFEFWVNSKFRLRLKNWLNTWKIILQIQN